MKITQEEVIDHQATLQIELDDEDLDTYLDQGYRRIVKRMLIPGFRKGKAPRSILEQYVGRENLLREVLDSMLPEVAGRAIDDQKLEACAFPQMELMELAPFMFKATVPLPPTVELGNYRDLKMLPEEVKITKDDVQQRLDQLRESMGSWEPVDRAAQMGDTVSMDVEARVEGRSILDNKDAVFFLEDSDEGPLPGLAKRLVGLDKEKSSEFSMSVSADYADSTIAGKKADLSVKIGEIKERVLPEIDDEFAKGLGDQYASLDELRKKVKTDLKTEADAKVVNDHRESVVSALLENAKIELPPILVERESEYMEDERSKVLDRVNVRMDDYLKSIGKTEEEMRGETREEAIDRLNRSFALKKVADLEGVSVSDDEVEERSKSMVSSSGKQAHSGRVTDEMRSSVRRMMLVERSVDCLASIAKGESVSTDDREEKVSEDKEEVEQGGDVDDQEA